METIASHDMLVSCFSCRRNVHLTYGGTGLYRWQPWICPHCRVQNGMNLSGAILGVKKPTLDH